VKGEKGEGRSEQSKEKEKRKKKKKSARGGQELKIKNDKGWEQISEEDDNALKEGSDIPTEMVFVEGGTSQMGSNSSDADYDEQPVHTVTIDDFYIGKYEVTQKEWREVMGNNPSIFKGDNRPVENVSWYDAVEFCNKMSELEGLEQCYSGWGDNIKCDFTKNGYRLPTEAEWEYAARGGNKSRGYKYAVSSNLAEVAWYDDNSGNTTHPVGQKQPNELGIYDMSGNVWEWCWDWYDGNYYKNSPRNNPQGPKSGNSSVLRGSSWSSNVNSCRVASRTWNSRYYSFSRGGFRFSRSAE